MTDIVMLGAGGTCADVLAIIAAANVRQPGRWNCLGVLDDAPGFAGARVHGLPVLGPIQANQLPAGALAVDCLGSPRSFPARESLLLARGFDPAAFATIIDDTAWVAHSAQIGPGSILFPHVVVMANVRLGMHVTVLANSVMNHETTVGDFTIVASGVNVSGRVAVGRGCYLGSGASIIHDRSIGAGALIGAGAVVVRDVQAGSVVAGNPARVLRGVDQ